MSLTTEEFITNVKDPEKLNKSENNQEDRWHDEEGHHDVRTDNKETSSQYRFCCCILRTKEGSSSRDHDDAGGDKKEGIKVRENIELVNRDWGNSRVVNSRRGVLVDDFNRGGRF